MIYGLVILIIVIVVVILYSRGIFNPSVTSSNTTTPIPGLFAYVANANSGTVSVINTATNKVIATVTVGNNPYG